MESLSSIRNRQKQQVKNNGEIPQYYVEGHHEAIIDADTFERVQREMEKRKGMDKKYGGVNPFSAKIKCGDCGGWYGSKVWHSNSKYRKVIFQCNHKFKNDCKCSTPHLTEEEIKQIFLKALQVAIVEKEELIANIKLMKEMVCEISEYKEEEKLLIAELNTIEEEIEKIIAENSRVALDQMVYQQKYDELEENYERVRAEYDKVTEKIRMAKKQEEQFKNFIEILEKADDTITEFDEEMWLGLVDFVTIKNKEDILVSLKGGMQIAV